ncbi:MAG: hypothetical protein ABIR96_03735 [Bdellovibrionota bacterium]
MADTMKTNESLFVRFHQSLVIPAGTGSETVAFVNGKRVLSPNGDEYLEGLKIGDKYCHFDIVKGESARVFAKGEYIRSKSSMMGAKSSDPRYYEFNLKDSDANLATMECAVVKSFNSEAGMVAREATLNEAQSALGDALSIN